jgi:hypothetical protein
MWASHFRFVRQDLADGEEIVDRSDIVVCVTIDGLPKISAARTELKFMSTNLMTKKSVDGGLCWKIGARMRLLWMIWVTFPRST